MKQKYTVRGRYRNCERENTWCHKHTQFVRTTTCVFTRQCGDVQRDSLYSPPHAGGKIRWNLFWHAWNWAKHTKSVKTLWFCFRGQLCFQRTAWVAKTNQNTKQPKHNIHVNTCELHVFGDTHQMLKRKKVVDGKQVGKIITVSRAFGRTAGENKTTTMFSL
jgi:hypothetical protein